jgi:hypothetical protein
MTLRRFKEPVLVRRSLRVGATIAASLVILAVAAPGAAATKLSEVAGAAGSIVDSVTEAPVPSLPQTPPVPPPPPVTIPTAPQTPVKVPSAPPVNVPSAPPVKVPNAPPTSSSAPQLTPATTGGPATVAGGGAGSRSDGVATGVEKQLRGAVTGISREGASSGAVAGYGRSDPSLNRQSGDESQSGQRPGAPPASGPRARAVGAAEAAPLRRWLAYVWPAVALGPFARALVVLLPDLVGASMPPMPDPARLFTQVLGVAASSGGSSLSEPVPTPQSSRSAPHSDLLPSSGGMSLLITILTILAALIGVVALARLTVGEEFFSMRWLH